jgi:hypothetical protein
MTKLEELKAAYDAAYKAELKKQEENSMTKLEELRVAYDATYETAAYAVESAEAAADAAEEAWDAYQAELKKTQEENSND